MNLTSCYNCGVVLDKDHLNFNTVYRYLPTGTVRESLATCPVCKEATISQDGESVRVTSSNSSEE